MNNLSKTYLNATINDTHLPAVQHATALSPDTDPRIRTLLETLPDLLDRDLSVTRLAEATKLSPSRLRKLFKEATGASPVQHVRALRLAEAARLLREEGLTVRKVMDKVGVGDYSDFLRDFKKVYRLTPSQYRNHYSRGTVAPEITRTGVFQHLAAHNRLGQLTPVLALG